VGLIYFPDQQKAFTGIRKVLKPKSSLGAIGYSTPTDDGCSSEGKRREEGRDAHLCLNEGFTL
jgi:hypothetical protein